MNDIVEEWKTVKNLDKYECSNLGNFRTKDTKRTLKTRIRRRYRLITLNDSNNKRQSFYAHILIAQTWIENPENKKTVDHINKIRDDNPVSNLRWATYKEQCDNIDYSKRKVTNVRPIWKCDKDTGEKIKLYNSVTEASMDVNGTGDTGNICSCLIGKISNAYGYKWIYPEDIKIEGEIFKLYLSVGKSNYYVSNKGRIKNNNRILKPTQDDEYCYITIQKKFYCVHDLVALLFIENPNKYKMVNHKDGNKKNNNVNNLEWINNIGNIMHAINTGLFKKVKKVVHYDEKGKIIKIYNSCMEASNEVKICRGSINKCCQGKIKACGTPKQYFKHLDSTDDIVGMKVSKKFIDKRKVVVKKDRAPIIKKKIAVHDKNNKIIDVCKDIAEISRKYKVCPATVNSHLKGKTKFSMVQYTFKYVE